MSIKRFLQVGSSISLALALAACANNAPKVQASKSKEVYSPAKLEVAHTVAVLRQAQTKARVAKAKKKNKLVLVRTHRRNGKQLQGVNAVRYANYKATRQPDTNDYFNAIMTFDFVPGDLYQVYCAPFDVTDIEFGKGEHITSVAAGDTLRWQVSKTYSGSDENYREHLLIKPMAVNIENSLVVTTDQHSYHMQLHATKNTYMAVVSWRYPENDTNKPIMPTDVSPLADLNLQSLDFDYSIKLIQGPKPDWIPTAVFTDGHKTYIQFPHTMQNSPLLFVGHSPSSDRVVNYRVADNYYVIDEVVDEVQLRLGQNSVSVVQIAKVSSA